MAGWSVLYPILLLINVSLCPPRSVGGGAPEKHRADGSSDQEPAEGSGNLPAPPEREGPVLREDVDILVYVSVLKPLNATRPETKALG